MILRKFSVLLIFCSVLLEIVCEQDAEDTKRVTGGSYSVETVSTDEGVFYSPGYPGIYPRNYLYRYDIHVGQEKADVQIDFKFFELENCAACSCDYLSIENRLTKALTFCGKTLPNGSGRVYLDNVDNYVWITFSSNGQNQFPGFYATYRVIRRTGSTNSGTVCPPLTCPACYLGQSTAYDYSGVCPYCYCVGSLFETTTRKRYEATTYPNWNTKTTEWPCWYDPVSGNWYKNTHKEPWWYDTSTKSWNYGASTEPWWYNTTTKSWNYDASKEPWWYDTTTKSWNYGTSKEPWLYNTTRKSWNYVTSKEPWWYKSTSRKYETTTQSYDRTTTEYQRWNTTSRRWYPTTTRYPWWDTTTRPRYPTTTRYPWWDTTTRRRYPTTTRYPWWDTTTRPRYPTTTRYPWWDTTTKRQYPTTTRYPRWDTTTKSRYPTTTRYPWWDTTTKSRYPTTTRYPWWDTTTISRYPTTTRYPWWDTTTKSRYPTTTRYPWWDTTTRSRYPTTTRYPWWDTTTRSRYPTTTRYPWWDTTTRSRYPTTTKYPWWDTTTRSRYPTTTRYPWWDTTTRSRYPTTTRYPWWDTTTESRYPTTTRYPWWDTTTRHGYHSTSKEPWWYSTSYQPWWYDTTTRRWDTRTKPLIPCDTTTSSWDHNTSPYPWYYRTTTENWRTEEWNHLTTRQYASTSPMNPWSTDYYPGTCPPIHCTTCPYGYHHEFEFKGRCSVCFCQRNFYSTSTVYPTPGTGHHCHKDFYSQDGVVETFGFPNPYPSNTTCDYRIHLKNDNSTLKTIAIQFESFNIEDCWQCRCDKLQIRGVREIDPSEQMCQQSRLSVGKTYYLHTKMDHVVIQFKSDLTVQLPGFRMKYHVMDRNQWDSCPHEHCYNYCGSDEYELDYFGCCICHKSGSRTTTYHRRTTLPYRYLPKSRLLMMLRDIVTQANNIGSQKGESISEEADSIIALVNRYFIDNFSRR